MYNATARSSYVTAPSYDNCCNGCSIAASGVPRKMSADDADAVSVLPYDAASEFAADPEVQPPASDPLGFGKLVKDTFYGIQKDVMKIVLIAGATVIYRALNHAATHGVRLPQMYPLGGGVLLVLLLGTVFLLSRQPDVADGVSYLLHRPSRIMAWVGGHPLHALALVVATVVMDRIGMIAVLQRLIAGPVATFASMVEPALRKLVTLGKPPSSPEVRRAAWRPLLLLLPVAVAQWLRVRSQRAARALLELDAGRGLWRKAGRVLQTWHPGLERGVQTVAAVVGTGSAIKYLLRR